MKICLLMLCALSIPASLMGQPARAAGDTLEHEGMVLLKAFGFYLDRYEVTNAGFAQFLNANGNQQEQGVPWIYLTSKAVGIVQDGEVFAVKKGLEQHPVVEVSIAGARAYCAWRGKRLPLDREALQACQGMEERTYPWGDAFESGRANLFGAKDGFERAAPVGSFPQGATPEGIHDLAGNVWEWIEGGRPDQPLLRGSSWINDKVQAQCTRTSSTGASHTYVKGNTIGLRCARSATR